MAKGYLTKELIHSSMEELRLPDDQFVIVGGAALQLSGIKRTRDIDVVVAMPTLFDYVARAGRGWVNGSRANRPDDIEIAGDRVKYAIREWVSPYEAVRIGHISLMAAPNDELYQATFEELHAEALDINGLPVSPPERILEWKQAVGRGKDQADIARLQRYISTAPSAVSV